MNIINLTPHEINIHTAVGFVTIKPSGQIARCSSVSKKIDEIDGIDIFKTSIGNVTDLPAMVEGTIYIVSMLVKTKELLRQDLFSPAEQIRNDRGVVIGCKGLNG